MAYSNVSYTSTGAQTYNVPFPYLDADHVKVYLNGVETSAFTWSDGATIHLNNAPAAGVIILIKRVTPRDGLDKSFSAQPRLKGTDLDEALLQAYYIGLEAMDAADPAVLQSYVDAAGVAAGEAEDAKDAAVVAQGAAVVAQGLAEDAQDAAEAAADLAATYAGSAGAGTYMEVPVPPTTDANEVKLYAKDVAGATELFIRKESNGSEIQVTSGNILNGTPPDASEGTKGIAELATQAEVNAGTDDARIVTPKKLLAAPMLHRKNLLINGDFRVWQRGSSFAAITSGAYHADRWRVLTAGEQVLTISQSTDSPASAEAYSPYSLKALITTADTSIAATQYLVLSQGIEGYTANRLYGARKATLSFWVKSSVTGTYGAVLRNGAQDRSYLMTYTINSANTWEKKTLSYDFTGATSAGTWNTTNGCGIWVDFTLLAGSNYQTATTGVWVNGGSGLSTSSQVNFAGTVNNAFYLSRVQFEVGDAATEFDERDYGTELALCQRYCEYGVSRVLQTTVITNDYLIAPFRVQKRAPGGTGYVWAGVSGNPGYMSDVSNGNADVSCSVAAGVSHLELSPVVAAGHLMQYRWACTIEL